MLDFLIEFNASFYRVNDALGEVLRLVLPFALTCFFAFFGIAFLFGLASFIVEKIREMRDKFLKWKNLL